MTILQEAVAAKIRERVSIRLGPNALEMANRGTPIHLTGGEADEAARASIEVLREGAYERVKAMHLNAFGVENSDYDASLFINAVLGPPPEAKS